MNPVMTSGQKFCQALRSRKKNQRVIVVLTKSARIKQARSVSFKVQVALTGLSPG
jgi:hypothetical protein